MTARQKSADSSGTSNGVDIQQNSNLRREVEALRRSEAALLELVETSAICHHWVGPDGTILWANQAELDLLGYRADEMIGRNLAEFHADERAVTDILDRLRRGDGLRGYPARLRHRDGSIKQVLINSSALFDDGKSVHTHCFTGDVTVAHEERDARQLLSAIVDSSDDAIISKDLNGVITSWNKSARRLFGWTAEEAIGKTVAELLIPDDRQDEEPEILTRLRRGERVDHFETVRRSKYGGLVDISLTISPVKDAAGRVIGASKIARDITPRKHGDRARALLSAIVDSSDDAIISKDLNGVITSWNQSAERLFGWTAAEAVGKTVAEMLIPEDRQDEEPGILAQLRSGARLDHFETVRRRKDGALLDVSLTISPIKDASGRVIGASKIARDVTERKRAEDDLRRANKDLEQFAFTASHDLQEPLRTIKVYSELLGDRYAGVVEGESAQFLEFLLTAATRMETLLRDLLSYTQISRLTAPLEDVDANQAFREALANLGGAIEESRARVTSEALPRLRAHVTHLRVLFQNLIGNAIKYRSPGRAPEIHVSAERHGGCWTFTVKDNGIGIEPQYKEQIFGLFSRLHNADRYGGTGIGLAICQRIVERYHGRIWVDSEPGGGSAFRFVIPG